MSQVQYHSPELTNVLNNCFQPSVCHVKLLFFKTPPIETFTPKQLLNILIYLIIMGGE
jgi:hypothetical protein